jgi:threonine/homoserine efflux transporter RhtA
MLGAAISTLAAYVLLTAFYLLISQRLYPTRYEGRKVFVTVTLATAIGALGVVPLGPQASELTLKLLGILIFLLGIRVLGVVGPEETREIKNLLGGIFRRPAAQARA